MVDTLSQNEIDALLSALTPSDDAVAAAAPEPASPAASSVSKETTPEPQSQVSDDLSALASFSLSQDSGSSSSSSSSNSSSSSESSKPKGKERPYNFKRQSKFSKAQINTLRMIHENFARLMGTEISTRLRMSVTSRLISVDQETFEEFVGSIFPPTFIAVFRSDSLDGKLMIQLDLSIVFSILDRQFGGNGAPLSTLRQLTDIEKQIMQKTMVNIIDRLSESWQNIVDLMPVIELVESNPQYAQMVPPNDPVVTIKIELSILDTTGFFKLCIPYSTVENVIKKLDSVSWLQTQKPVDRKGNNTFIEDHLKATDLPFVVELGRAVYPLEDIVNLQPGDYLLTSQLVKNDLAIRVGNQVKLFGRPGRIGKKMAVTITKVIEPPSQEEDE